MAGVKQPSVSDWNAPNKLPEMKNIAALAKELHVSFEWLVTRRGSMHVPPVDDPVAQKLWRLWPGLSIETRNDIVGHASLSARPPPPISKKRRNS